jgi:hypothetical protein
MENLAAQSLHWKEEIALMFHYIGIVTFFLKNYCYITSLVAQTFS